MTTREITDSLKQEASKLGFLGCGISRAEALTPEASRLDEWLSRGYHGTMSWMKQHHDKRTDPTRLVDGARSVISLIHSYYNDEPFPDDPSQGKISRYAWNKDYHRILRKKISSLLDWLNDTVGPTSGRAFVDSAPVMDKAWAQRAGLGWIGKHTNLINRKAGSYFFIGELIVDRELRYDEPEFDHCGTCRRCIDACPTDAITEPYVLDATKCISYLTIEHRGDDIDDDLKRKSGNWIFGCDICQEVCPWNKFSVETGELRFQPVDERYRTPLRDWLEMSPEAFDRIFAGSAVRRTGYEGFMRNVKTALKNIDAESRDD